MHDHYLALKSLPAYQKNRSVWNGGTLDSARLKHIIYPPPWVVPGNIVTDFALQVDMVILMIPLTRLAATGHTCKQLFR
jgi:hypothetical protein